MFIDKIIYTDGACETKLGHGGIGIVSIDGYTHEAKEYSKAYRETTNNRMELMAVIVALEMYQEPLRIEIVSDSTYVVNAINKGWLKKWVRNDFKGRPNTDLWKRLIKGLQFHKVTFKWVRGHDGNSYNELVDKLAVKAREALKDDGEWTF